MKKILITSITALAIVLNAGMSMAGPLNGHSFGGKAHDMWASFAQPLNTADSRVHANQTNLGFGSGQENLSSTQPLGTDNFKFDFENHSGGNNGTPVIFWSPK